MYKKIIGLALAAGMFSVALPTFAATVTVSGNTAAGENQPGWMFNRDTSTQTPFEFNLDQHSLGIGSLFVKPITNTINGSNDKFIAEDFLLTPIADISNVSFDFMINPSRTASDTHQYYWSIYTNFGTSSPTKFYDCRYDIVATTGSNSAFNTVTFDPTHDYTGSVTTRTGGSASPFACPGIPAQMDTIDPSASSTIRAITINVGDTSAFDTGVSGYLDNVVVNKTNGDNTVYDFEPDPSSLISNNQGGFFSSIQAAIDGTNAGGTITVPAGTYDENLTINKSLTLKGARADVNAMDATRASAVATTSPNFSNESEITGTVTVSASGVTLDGFTVRNDSNAFGVNLTGNYGNYTIEDNIIRDNSYGVLINGTDSSTASTISHNAFIGNNTGSAEGHGISAQSETDNVTIAGNYFEDNWNSAGNSESINFYGSTPDGAFYHQNVAITDNQLYDTSLVFGSVDGLTITGNVSHMQDTADSTALFIAGDVKNATITGNTLEGHTRSLYISPDFFSLPTASSNFTVTNNKLLGATTGVEVANGRYTGTLDVTQNWWGDASGPATSTNPDGTGSAIAGDGAVSYSPWWNNAGMTTFGNTVIDNGTTAQATIPNQTSTTTNTTSGDVTIDIPAGMVITGPTGWDGTLDMPTVVSTTVAPTPDSGNTATVVLSIEVGDGNNALTFDQPVELMFAGQAGNSVGWSRSGNFTPITAACDSATPPTLADGADCKISDNGSGNLIVWTRHFTTFTTYTQTAQSSGGSSGSSSGGGGGGNGAPVGTLGTVSAVIPTVATTGGTNTGGVVLGAAAYQFANNLRVGSRGQDVIELQTILIAEGDLSIAAPTGYFGALTKAAVIKYQTAHSISPMSGYVGPLTRAELNKGSTPTTPESSGTVKQTLTDAQVSAIVNLVASFGADQATITNVSHALGK